MKLSFLAQSQVHAAGVLNHSKAPGGVSFPWLLRLLQIAQHTTAETQPQRQFWTSSSLAHLHSSLLDVELPAEVGVDAAAIS
eukprot:8558315-Pyramimonas_sp.AAC.1